MMRRFLAEQYRHYIHRLSQALLACPSLQDRDRRGALLLDLPERIRHQLNSNLPTPLAIVPNLVETCANYAEGEASLFRALHNAEAGSVSQQQAQAEWKTIRQEMTEQDQLIAWIWGSGVAWDELQRLFVAVTPQDYVARPHSVETLVRDLWEVQTGHKPLLAFLQRLAARPDISSAVRPSVEGWCRAAPGNRLLRQVSEGERPLPSQHARIIVTIQLGTQDETMRFVTFWLNKGEDLEHLREFRVESNRLEQMVAKELDRCTIKSEATGAIEAIEFYLPKTLLAVPVDSWKIKSGHLEQRFIERYRVLKGILERQEARGIRAQLARASGDYQERLLDRLERNPLQKELVRRSGDWEKRWGQVNGRLPLPFATVTQTIDPGELPLLADDTAFALFTFSPPGLDSINLDDPVGQIMIAGVPLLAWVRAAGESADLRAYVRQHLFEAHCACAIHVADDVIGLMHAVCRRPAPATDPYPIGQNLNLIVDNPERKLPYADRVTM